MPGLCIVHAHKANRDRCAGHILASDGSDVALHVPSSDGLRGLVIHACGSIGVSWSSVLTSVMNST